MRAAKIRHIQLIDRVESKLAPFLALLNLHFVVTNINIFIETNINNIVQCM